jgi:hypothetical protein
MPDHRHEDECLPAVVVLLLARWITEDECGIEEILPIPRLLTERPLDGGLILRPA